ncbi:rhodopsin, GQ-coupled-like [Strongylocentrotus purpuratus]|uniref:G-protein coupled receptors family 1 profile domain-containing protein n=1 Tax=Strongylocentrotus purpuratus TaxID=7668 RepID=A0A7M7RH42_STRPU|nr:rhodopsin, GQ-coupled-like [Strongylocentrotus purpuratus]|eukprot:XP_796413.2 PREDICTED: rhodopsin, GQ-coupled-like [Strongylocentrotus purpuratus]
MEATEGAATEIATIAFYHRVIVASILIGASIIGLFGNTLVIISVLITKKLRTITNILVVNLAIADFLTCACLPFQVIGFLSQTGSYPLPEGVCATVAAVLHTCLVCSASTLVVIGFIRRYVITRSIRGHQGFHTPKKIATVAVFIWMESAAFMVLPPVLGIGRLGYSSFYGMCAFIGYTRMALYYVASQGIFIATILMLTLIFYGLILRHVLRHNKQFRGKFAVDKDTSVSSTEGHQNKASTSDSPLPMIKAINQKEIEITKNVFTVVCLFIVCFLASSVNFIIPGSSVSTLYGYMIMLTNSVVNPIIYGLKHPNFQEAFKKILCCRRAPQEFVSN